jgi:hypothetical protein
MATPSPEKWLQTDELEEFIGALRFAAELVPSVVDDPVRWKWVIIALHNALQGVCVCALRGADPTGISVLDRVSGAAMWHWLDVVSREPEHPPPPEEKLAKTLELYKRVKTKQYLDNPLPLDTARDANIRRLNFLRNEFIHFVPKGLSIEMSGMPLIVESVCFSVEHLAISFPTFGHHFKEGHRDCISGALSVLRANSKTI